MFSLLIFIIVFFMGYKLGVCDGRTQEAERVWHEEEKE